MADTTTDPRAQQQPPRFMFAGPQADTADGTLLDQAKRMEKKRTPQAMIFQTTGWFRGVDGRWRYEISDHDAKFKIGIPKEVEEDVIARVDREAIYEPDDKIIWAKYRPDDKDYLGALGFTQEDARKNLIRNLIKREYPGFRSLEQLKDQYVKLEDVLDHPRLYAAYPQLAKLTVQFSTQMNGTTKGQYSRGEGIVLNANRAEADILSTLLHEIQHAIQAGEGFAMGGSPDPYWTGAIKSTLAVMDDDYQRRIDRWLERHDDLVDEHHTASDMVTYGLMYESVQRLRSHGNRDRPSGVLRLIKQEMGWVYHEKVREDPELRRRFDELERNWYNLPKRHKMQARNAFLREQCWNAAEMIQEVIPPDVYREFHQDDRQTRSMIKALERAASKARKALEPLRELEQEKRAADALKEKYQYSSAFEVYRALAGEVEARNTQARQRLNPEERRRNQPEMTADVKRDEAIVIFEETGYQHIVTPHRVSDAAPDYLYTPPGEGRPLTRETASYIANSLMLGWAGRPKVEVVNRVSELPRKLQKDIDDARAYHDVRAAFWNETAYLIAPRLPSREALEEVLLHEVVGHYGLRKMLNDDLAPTLETVYQNFGRTDLARDLKVTYFQGTAFDEGDPDHRQLVAEEMMAHMAESGDHQSLDLWDRFDSHTRAGLREMGYQLPMTSTDLLYILQGAQRVVQAGGISQPSEFDRRFRLAYHGSPHLFDRFSLEAVGSGEGQQAYGYGLYFAGHRSVAEFYRATVQNDIYVPDVAQELGIELPSPRPPVAAAIKRLSWENRLSSDDAAKRVQWQVRAAREMDLADIAALIEEIRSRQNGNLYEVNIPDDDQLLNRDAPLSKQSETVKAILREIDFPLTSTDSYAYQASVGVDPFVSAETDEPTGADLQAAIARAADQQTFDRQGPIWDLVKDDPNRLNYSLSQITSIYLNSLGIPGLLYRDAFSRTDDAEGTSNYVIWDDQVVTIEAVNEEIQPSIAELFHNEAFTRWFGNSQVVDDSGNPLVLYHGTGADFSEFQPSATGLLGPGIYLTSELSTAEQYNGAFGDGPILQVYANLQSPFRFKVDPEAEIALDFESQAASALVQLLGEIEAKAFLEKADEFGNFGDEFKELLQQRGYDGIVADWGNGILDVIAFDPEQVKSATDNAGTFDPGSADIRFSRASEVTNSALKKWFGNSKVIGDNGEPLVVYHGTMSEVDQFHRGDGGTFGAGIYFTRNPDEASFWAGAREADGFEAEYGGSVIPAYVSINNPADEELASDYEAQYGSDAWIELEKLGYDGVIAGDEIVAFHPEQVKSAIGNTGAFDSSNPDIRFSRDNVIYFPTQDQPDYEAGMTLLHQLDDEELAGWLNEQFGIDASDLTRENQILEAHSHGLHRILNQHYTDLIEIALDRFEKGQDTATEAAKTIAFQIEKQGAYGYDLQRIQPVMAQAAGNGTVQSGKPGPTQPDQARSTEDRFRSFLYQELGFQEECLLMAELAPDGDEVSIRRRQDHHRKEVEELREHLSMLDAGMSVAEIRQATQRSRAPARSAPAGVTSLQDHLAMARAYQGCMGEPEDDRATSGPAPG